MPLYPARVLLSFVAAFCYIQSACFGQQAEITGVEASALTGASSPISAIFSVKDYDPKDSYVPPRYKALLSASDWKPLDKSRHDTIDKAFQAIVPMRNIEAPAEPCPWLTIYIYVHRDNYWWAELALMNDSMEDPLGYLEGDLLVMVGGKVAGSWQGGQIFDQTGWVVGINTPRLAPDKERLARYMKNYPKDVRLGYDTNSPLYTFARLRDVEDPTRSTHQTGSPRNMLWAYEADAVWNYMYLEPPDQARYWRKVWDLSLPMLRFAYEQVGTSHRNEMGAISYHHGRPYHLHRYAEGFQEPIDSRKYYSYDSETPQRPAFHEGSLSLRRHRTAPTGWDVETFGRIGLETIEGRDWDTSEWIGKRVLLPNYVSSYSYFNGWDYEHMASERLLAAVLCTPSEVARQALLTLGGTVFRANFSNHHESGAYCRGWLHSSRTFGWTMRTALNLYLATDDELYLNIARAMTSLFWDRDEHGKRRYEQLRDIPPMHASSAHPFALTRNMTLAPLYWKDLNWSPNEAMWQASVAANALFLLFDHDPDPVWAEMALEAGVDIMKGCALTYKPEQGGFFENYRPRKSNPLLNGQARYDSTRAWAMDGFAKAWHETKDETFAFIQRVWETKHLSGTRHPKNKKSEGAHKWNRYCANYLGGW